MRAGLNKHCTIIPPCGACKPNHLCEVSCRMVHNILQLNASEVWLLMLTHKHINISDWQKPLPSLNVSLNHSYRHKYLWMTAHLSELIPQMCLSLLPHALLGLISPMFLSLFTQSGLNLLICFSLKLNQSLPQDQAPHEKKARHPRS